MWKWILATVLPLGTVYLLAGHPALTRADLFGFTEADMLKINLALTVLISGLGWLFSRFRAAVMAVILLAFALVYPQLLADAFRPETVAASLAVLGSCLIAAPELRFFSPRSLAWVALSLGMGLGSLIVGSTVSSETARWVFLMICAVCCISLITARCYQDRRPVRLEVLLVAPLLGAVSLGLTVAWMDGSFGEAAFLGMIGGFQLLCLAAVVDTVFRLAYIDELTEIPGRRALMEALRDPGPTFTLAMLDVDHFKKFNDTHGHEVGDQVLRMVAAKLSTVGEGGSAYRYGGEEFTLFFPGKTEEEVESELERLRELVASSPMTLRGADRPKEKPKKQSSRKPKPRPQVSVTVSIGAASRKSKETWDKVLKRADQALYKAKAAGRNRVARAS